MLSSLNKGAAPKHYMIRQVYDSSSSTMGNMHTCCSDKQRKKNPHRSQRGISSVCVCDCVCVSVHVRARVHVCYYPLSSCASITTSSWIIQRYKIKEQPCACWRINGLINDEREDDKPKGLLQCKQLSFIFLCDTVSACMHVDRVYVEKLQTKRCTQTYTYGRSYTLQSFYISLRGELQHKAAGSWTKQFYLTLQ